MTLGKKAKAKKDHIYEDIEESMENRKKGSSTFIVKDGREGFYDRMGTEDDEPFAGAGSLDTVDPTRGEVWSSSSAELRAS